MIRLSVPEIEGVPPASRSWRRRRRTGLGEFYEVWYCIVNDQKDLRFSVENMLLGKYCVAESRIHQTWDWAKISIHRINNMDCRKIAVKQRKLLKKKEMLTNSFSKICDGNFPKQNNPFNGFLIFRRVRWKLRNSTQWESFKSALYRITFGQSCVGQSCGKVSLIWSESVFRGKVSLMKKETPQ